MRLILVAGFTGILFAFATGASPGAVWETVQQFYPNDPVQRQALDHCFMEDHRFDRFDRVAREECYRRSAAAVGSADRIRTNGNFVDLWRSAGLGRLPRGDVRFEEQMARYFHPAEAGGGR